MDSSHLVGIVQNLLEYVLCNAKFDKGYIKERLSELGWTDFDLEWFNAKWMFED